MKTLVALAVSFCAFSLWTASAHAASRTPEIVFLINENPDNYEAHLSIPPFAAELQRTQGFKTRVLKAEGEMTAARFPDLESALAKADLVVVFCRRLALPHAQLAALKAYLKAGKPLVGIRTANHAFAPRGTVAEGHAAWAEFVPDILGCENRGYGSPKFGTDVAVVPAQSGHAVLKGVTPQKWHTIGNVYQVAPLLDQKATVLATGTIPDRVEPIAWTRLAGKSRIFYTSLGHPADFTHPQYRTLLTNGIRWALGTTAR